MAIMVVISSRRRRRPADPRLGRDGLIRILETPPIRCARRHSGSAFFFESKKAYTLAAHAHHLGDFATGVSGPIRGTTLRHPREDFPWCPAPVFPNQRHSSTLDFRKLQGSIIPPPQQRYAVGLGLMFRARIRCSLLPLSFKASFGTKAS